jgi:hypothetical protein
MEDNTEYIEWQWPLSDIHSIMMEKSAQPGEGGNARSPLPFTVSTITSKVVVYTTAERADTFLLFLLFPYMYSVRDSVPGYAHQVYVVSCLLVLQIFDF